MQQELCEEAESYPAKSNHSEGPNHTQGGSLQPTARSHSTARRCTDLHPRDPINQLINQSRVGKSK